MKIKENISLKPYNTFGVEASARYFVEVATVEDVQELVVSNLFQKEHHLFLGGGSNILFTKDFDGLVIKNNLKGIEVLEENNNEISVRVMSGENWHDFVMYAVERGWGGIENLALIPGTVGATPVQNIGAYGVEIQETVASVEAVSLKGEHPMSAIGGHRMFTKEECHFGYRDSVFKKEAKGQYFITSVTFKLSKNKKPNISYQALQTELAERKVKDPSVQDVAEAVIAIRKSKLPDPVVIGNAGSFFKNPQISPEKFSELQRSFADVPFFEGEGGLVKVPAAWFIEKAGWKGKRVGNTGAHERQPLVLVNHGEATGQEIKSLSEKIQRSVQEKFDIELETEVTIL